METTQSINIINQMLQESKRSLHRNSFYFILWGIILLPAAFMDFFLYGQAYSWLGWPIVGAIGGIVSGIYGSKEGRRSGEQTIGDRISMFTWGAFVFALLFVLFYSIANRLSTYPLVLLVSGMATFISGGISKFRPFLLGAAALALGALLCAFFVQSRYHGLVFIVAMVLGYLIPGLLLKKTEHAEA
ncbi:MAG: hypothetical protein RIE58_01450 [Vicingaceae bacterium]